MIPQNPRCVKRQIWGNCSKSVASVVFLDKEITLHSGYSNKIARTCCVTHFKSLPWQLLTFLIEERISRTKTTWAFYSWKEMYLLRYISWEIIQASIETSNKAIQFACGQAWSCRRAPVPADAAPWRKAAGRAAVRHRRRWRFRSFTRCLLGRTCPFITTLTMGPVKNRPCKYVTECLMFTGWFPPR